MTTSQHVAQYNNRLAGVLLHISSLPSQHHVGDLGENAYRFVDVLQQMHVKVWQTLPINMPHADNSPYQCLSAHAGNPDFISLEALISASLLNGDDVKGATSKNILMARAYQNFALISPQTGPINIHSFDAFCHAEHHWLQDFALFLALRQQFDHTCWFDWPLEYKNRDAATIEFALKTLQEEITLIQFTQYVFFSQWQALKSYANAKDVQLFGDIPIFVAYDSAEVWAIPQLFKLDCDKKMTVVAGVPPDYFSVTGQRWGNPHYNWKAMQEDGFAWWIHRMKTQSTLFDMVRIDHFRGLEAAWEIPTSAVTGIHGEWVEAPGNALLSAIKEVLPNVILIAEDLGIITDKVTALRETFAMPGMKILQFAFSGQEDNPYLPHNITKNSVIYTGTHDNNTTLGWFLALDDNERLNLNNYLKAVYGDAHTVNMPQDLMSIALASEAYLTIIPMQDLLGLDANHRMNVPGTISGNWHWRFDWQQLQTSHIEWLSNTITQHNRH